MHCWPTQLTWGSSDQEMKTDQLACRVSTEQPEFPKIIQTCEHNISYQLTFAMRHRLNTQNYNWQEYQNGALQLDIPGKKKHHIRITVG
jgi:hypothetical protein